MRNLFIYALIAFSLSFTPGAQAGSDGKHLFILSGQSNMVRLNESSSFIPALEKEFGLGNVIVVKDAMGSQSIRRWYKGWDANDTRKPGEIGDLYDRLMQKVEAAIFNEEIATVTFCWMQGEADASANNWEQYREALDGLISQLRTDLGREDINVVIGRLSDFDMSDSKRPHWTMIREIQMEIASSSDRIVYVDTDDLNDGINKKGETVENDLHYTPEGYKIFGERLAAAAIKLIQN